MCFYANIFPEIKWRRDSCLSMSFYNWLRDENIDLLAKLDFQPCQMKTCLKLNLPLSESLFSFSPLTFCTDFQMIKNKSIKDRYSQLARMHTCPLSVPLSCVHVAVGDEWQCSGWSKQVRGAAPEWATSFYRCTAIQWCFCLPLARLLQVQLSDLPLCYLSIQHTAAAHTCKKKKRKKWAHTCYLLLGHCPV